MIDSILDLKLLYYCDLSDEEDRYDCAYETETMLIKTSDDFIKGNFSTDFSEIWYLQDFENKTIRDYLNDRKDNKVVFFPFDGGCEIEMENFNEILYITPLENQSFLPLAIKEDEGQPQRAVMNFLLTEADKSHLPKEQFFKLLKDSVHQIVEDYIETGEF